MISSNLQKYVEKHCNDLKWVHSRTENKASYNIDYVVADLIDFFGDDWKEIKMQNEKRIFIVVKNIAVTKN